MSDLPKTIPLPPDNLDDLKARVREAAAADVQRCGEAIQQILKEHGCTLVAKPIISDDGRVGAQVTVAKVNE